MLLVLHDSLANALDQNIVLEALEMIALARREGKHLVFAKRHVLKSLRNCSELSKRTRQTRNPRFHLGLFTFNPFGVVLTILFYCTRAQF